MHTTSPLVIKVWDLLRNPGKIDIVSCEWVLLDGLEWLTSDGISVTLALQWINGGSIKVIVKNLEAMLSDVCDLSGEEYDRKVTLIDKHITYSNSLPEDISDDNSLYDDTLPRDGEHEMIDLQDGIRQLIILETPLVRIKPGKEYILDQFDDGDDE